jgi:uncharacterized membrane protein YqaE (UPF0057 family)
MKYLFCLVLPPLAVLLANRKLAFVLNIFLTLCFWIPGVIHAILVVNAAEADRRHEELLRALREDRSRP